jgi:plastocyanin
MRIVRTMMVTLFAIGLLAIAGTYAVIRNGLAADRPPGRLETAVARRLVWLSIPADARAQPNPQAGNGDAWRAGADHFAEHCAVCHGRTGRGDSELGPRMYPPVPDLSSPSIQDLSDGALFAIIQNGVRWTGMPSFRALHNADETWTLVSFIRHVPRLTPAAEPPVQQGRGADRDRARSVAMDGTTFSPGEVGVRVGETVVWVNKDPFPHNVTSAVGGFGSGDLEPGQEWLFQAATAGTFPYVCTLHPGMKGTLIVNE